jgi:RHS repeat-associated protein
MSVGQLVGYDRLHDVLGSVVALANSAGQVVERYDYDPYGTTTIMDAAAVPLALKPIDPAAADGYYHDHDRDGDIDAADYTDLMDCVNNTPYDPMCIYTHDRTGDRRVDIVDVGVYLAYADDQGLAGGTSAPELVHYGRPLRLQFDADGDGRVDMFDWYAMQTCFTKNSTRCKYLFDDNGDGVVNFYDLANFKQAADGPQGGPGATQWRRKLVASRYGNPFMWTGQRYDATTGQYHFWARTYSPRLGRWMQRDPLEYIDGVSLSEYSSSDPVDRIDSLGLSRWVERDGLHGYIVIGPIDGVYYRIELVGEANNIYDTGWLRAYGVLRSIANFLGRLGLVTGVVSVQIWFRPPGPPDFVSSEEWDRELLLIIIDDHGYWHPFFRNCWQFCWEYDDLPTRPWYENEPIVDPRRLGDVRPDGTFGPAAEPTRVPYPPEYDLIDFWHETQVGCTA